MKIYFDTCSLNRPLDDKRQLRVALEAEAVLGVLALCEAGAQAIVSSEVLMLENGQNSQAERHDFVAAVLEQSTNVVVVTDAVVRRAKALEVRGIKAFDALHVACAEAGQVNYFCTCDDRLLKKSRRQSDLSVKVVSPLELAEELSP